jgi:hypothetical protein
MQLRGKEMPRGAEFSIAANYAQLVWPFVSNDENRYLLNGFYVQRHNAGGAVIVGTDGRSMGVFHDQFGECRIPAIVRLSKTTLSACAEGCSLVLTGDRASVYQMWNKDTGEGILVAAQDQAVIEGDFPDWRALVPPIAAETQPATFAFTELKKFEKVREFGSKIAALRVFATGPNKPAVVRTARDDFVGVIMSLAGMEENGMPQWMPRPLATVSPRPEAAAE